MFVNEQVLDYKYVPEEVLFRDKELNVMVSSVKPLFTGGRGTNLLVFGKPGVGKTLCAKKLVEEVGERAVGVKPFFVNCWNVRNHHQLVVELLKSINYPFTQGKSSEELFQEFKKRTKQSKGLVIVLDEVDKLDDYDVLYLLVEELNNVVLILVCNDKNFLFEVEPRVLSRLGLVDLEFKPYSLDQIKEILLQRVRLAFKPGVWSGELLNWVVRETYHAQDVRVGLFLLLKAGEKAESKGLEVVTKECVESAVKSLTLFRISDLSVLSEDEKLLLKVVEEREGLSSGEALTEYRARGGVLSDRSFRRLVLKLARLELLRVESSGKGYKGRSKFLFLGPKMRSV